MINQKLPLITTKPVVYLVNISKADFIAKKNKWLGKIAAWVQSHGGGCIIPFSIAFESELKAATDAGQRSDYLESVAPAISSIPKMIRQVRYQDSLWWFQPWHHDCWHCRLVFIAVQGYQDLELRYFFTAGVMEVRCWTFLAGNITLWFMCWWSAVFHTWNRLAGAAMCRLHPWRHGAWLHQGWSMSCPHTSICPAMFCVHETFIWRTTGGCLRRFQAPFNRNFFGRSEGAGTFSSVWKAFLYECCFAQWCCQAAGKWRQEGKSYEVQDGTYTKGSMRQQRKFSHSMWQVTWCIFNSTWPRIQKKNNSTP